MSGVVLSLAVRGLDQGEVMKKRTGWLKRAVCAPALMLLAGATNAMGTFSVTTAADSGTGSLRQAIADANAAGGGTINMNPGGPINLLSPLPPVMVSTTINGGSTEVRGSSLFRVFFVDVAGGTVVLNDLTIRNGRAKGGNGGLGGGGGLGAGGGLFVSRGNVTVANVNFLNTSAAGGAGGDVGGSGGGGGLGGNGGNNFGGGGGLGGSGGNGYGDLTIAGGGGGGLDTNGENGLVASGRGGGEGGIGAAFGGGEAGTTPSRGGGGGSLAYPGAGANSGGSGGRFGGGGAGSRGGTGGFGGGGGAGNPAGGPGGVGGNGGFGAGGGGGNEVDAYGLGGAFAANGGLVPSGGLPDKSYNSGGGGAALGAQIFVRGGASLTLIDTAANRGTLTGGSSGTGGLASGPGQTAGDGCFLSGPTTISVTAGKTQRVDGSIVDVGDYINHPTAAGFEYVRLTKTGAGILVLSQPNTYRGGTVISQGTIVTESPAGTLGPGKVTINDGNTGPSNTALISGNSSFTNAIDVVDAGTGVASIGSAPGGAQSVIFSGPISLYKNLTVLGQNSSPLDAKNETGQTRLDSVISGAGGLTIAGGHMVQFRTNAKSYSGRTVVTAGSTLSIYNGAATPFNSIAQIDAGGTVVLEGIGQGTFSGLTGVGILANNENWGLSHLNLGSTNAATVSSFSGTITGSIQLNKFLADTQELGAQDNINLGITVGAGRLRLTGDQRIQSLELNKTLTGSQLLDLNGHLVTLNGGSLAVLGMESRLNRNIGTSSDGIYDSTADGHPNSRIGIALTLGDGKPLRMKLTIAGDADLDGSVGFSDLVAMAQHYGSGENSALWDDGDFNYDQKVDFSDLVVIAQNYGGSLASLPIAGASAEFQNDLASAFALVPEPSGIMLICGAAGAFITRRRRGC